MRHRPRTQPPRHPELVPALPRPAWIVLGGGFTSAVGSGLTLPFLFIYAHQIRHLTDPAAGLVVATFALGALAAAAIVSLTHPATFLPVLARLRPAP